MFSDQISSLSKSCYYDVHFALSTLILVPNSEYRQHLHHSLQTQLFELSILQAS